MKTIEQLIAEGRNEAKNNYYYSLTYAEMNALKEHFTDLSNKHGSIHNTLFYFIADVYFMGVAAGVRLEHNRQKRNKKEKQPVL